MSFDVVSSRLQIACTFEPFKDLPQTITFTADLLIGKMLIYDEHMLEQVWNMIEECRYPHFQETVMRHRGIGLAWRSAWLFRKKD